MLDKIVFVTGTSSVKGKEVRCDEKKKPIFIVAAVFPKNPMMRVTSNFGMSSDYFAFFIGVIIAASK